MYKHDDQREHYNHANLQSVGVGYYLSKHSLNKINRFLVNNLWVLM